LHPSPPARDVLPELQIALEQQFSALTLMPDMA